MNKKPPEFFTTLLLYAVLFVLSEILRPKPNIEDAKPAGLGDFQFPTATESRVVPLLWGTVRVKGPNVVWYGDFRQEPIKETIKTGLFSKKTIIKGYKYHLGMQLAFCRGGPTGVDLLSRVWIGDDEVFSGVVNHNDTFTIDCPELFGGDELGNGGTVGTLRFFAGTPTQGISTYLAGRSTILTASVAAGGTGYAVDDILTLVGGTFTQVAKFQVNSVGGSGEVLTASVFDDGNYSAAPTSPTATTGGSGSGCTLTLTFDEALQEEGGDTPAYRGTCFMAPDTENIYLGNSTSIKPWSVELSRIPTYLGLTSDTVNTYDANPMNVIYELMTDTEWGFGFSASTIDLANFVAAGNTLRTEGNGFSYFLDRQIEASELLKLLQEQVDGIVFFNQLVGKWQINLARDDYDVLLVPEITVANRHDLESFARGSWEDTTNEVRTKFNDRDDEYKETFGFAQDLSNIRVLQGVAVTVESNLPGVKNAQLATNIAWRKLRTLSYPLAKATVVVDRTFYATQPGSVVSFTDANLGLNKLAMRVQRVDLGELHDNKVRLDLIQDVFTSAVGSFAPAPNTGWEPPTDALRAFDANKQVAFEAPRGFITRDPDSGGAITAKVWAGARRKGPEVGFKITERHHPTTPTGSFTEIGESFQLFLIGKLQAPLAVGSAVPLSTLTITPNPDLQTALEALFTDGASVSDIGANLINLILVDNEFMLPTSAQTSGANVQLNGTYRGVLDSVQSVHSTGANVYLLFAGGNLSTTALPETDQVHIKLLPFSATDELPEGSATQIAFQMRSRARRPIAPSRLSLDGTAWASTTSLEANGAGAATYGIDLSIIRRDYRAMDEIPPLTTDAATLDATFPTANNTVHSVAVRNDPSGTNTLLFTDTFSGTQHDVLRLRILQATDGVIPTNLRFEILANHDDGGSNYDSLVPLRHDFTVSSALTGQFNFTALDTNDVSSLYTATVAGTYAFTLSSAFTAGNVQYRLNGGAFTNLITAGNTSGSILGVVISDTIEIRHTSTDVGALKQLDMNAPGAGQDGYAILFV
jgi:hypothetical protein